MKPILTIVKILISAAILWYLFAKAQREGQFAELFSGPKNWSWFLIAIGLCFAFHLVGFIRWYLLAHAMELPLRWADAIRIGFIGQFFGLVAFGVIGGDSLRAFYAAGSNRRLVGKAVASVFFDRAIGLFAMTGFAGVAYFFLPWSQLEEAGDARMIVALQSASLLMLLLSVVGWFGIFSMLFASERLVLRSYEWSVRIPLLGPFLAQLIKAIRLLRNRKKVVWQALLLSGLCNTLIILNVYSVALFVGGNHPGFWEHGLISPIAMIANSLPLPGGLGGMEAVLDLQYQALSSTIAGQNTGVVVGFLYRFVLLLISLTGSVMWLSMGTRERQSLESMNEASPG